MTDTTHTDDTDITAAHPSDLTTSEATAPDSSTSHNLPIKSDPTPTPAPKMPFVPMNRSISPAPHMFKPQKGGPSFNKPMVRRTNRGR